MPRSNRREREDAKRFFRKESRAWAPFAALLLLDDETLERTPDPSGPLHGWSGRDLMAHMAYVQETCLEVARELETGVASPYLAALYTDWATRGGDAVNRDVIATFREIPIAEVRRRFRESEVELRRQLACVPLEHWVSSIFHHAYFKTDTIIHCEAHLPELFALVPAGATAPAKRRPRPMP